MKSTWTIARKEIISFFVSPIAYFVITGFALLAGYFFFNLLYGFNIIVARYSSMGMMAGMGPTPNLNQYVVEGYYQTLLVTLVFLIPIITMRVLAEERQRGTFEMLVTSPLSAIEIALGKFIGVASVIFAMIFVSFLFPLALCFTAQIEIAPVISGFVGMLLCAFAFASIGTAISAYTENQVVAGVTSMVLLLILYLIHSPAELIEGWGKSALEYMSPVLQFSNMAQGVVTLSATIYFLSLISLGIFFCVRAIEAERWR